MKRKTPLKDKEHIYTAYHEAGHAAIFFLLGQPIDSIYTDGISGGKVNGAEELPTSFPFENNILLDCRMEVFALRCLSGYSAEYKYRKKRFMGLMFNKPDSIDGDFNVLWREMGKANIIIDSNEYNEFWFHSMQNKTRRLINKKHTWIAITELAKCLIKKKSGTISGNTVFNILSKHLKFYAVQNRIYAKNTRFNNSQNK